MINHSKKLQETRKYFFQYNVELAITGAMKGMSGDFICSYAVTLSGFESLVDRRYGIEC